MRVVAKKERAENENEVRVFFESLNFEIQMRVSQDVLYEYQLEMGILR